MQFALSVTKADVKDLGLFLYRSAVVQTAKKVSKLPNITKKTRFYKFSLHKAVIGNTCVLSVALYPTVLVVFFHDNCFDLWIWGCFSEGS